MSEVSGMGTVPPHLRIKETLSCTDQYCGVAVGSGLGGDYLVVELPGWAGPCWVCAPVSGRAVDCVRQGRVSPWTVLHHSSTGTVEIFRTASDGSMYQSMVLCASLPHFPPARVAA